MRLKLKKAIKYIISWLKGGTTISLSAPLQVSGNGNGYRVSNDDETVSVDLSVGSGGTNHGVWSVPLDKWMVYSDGTYTWFNNSNGGYYRWDMNTNNTTDTWVPVLRNGVFEHRAIPINYNRVPNVGAVQGTNTEETITGTGDKVLCSLNYTTNTGRFVVLGRAVMKTSRYTSTIWIRSNGVRQGYPSGTNSTSFITVNPIWYTLGATAGQTYTIDLAMTAQDSGTTGTKAGYNAPWLLVFDIP